MELDTECTTKTFKYLGVMIGSLKSMSKEPRQKISVYCTHLQKQWAKLFAKHPTSTSIATAKQVCSELHLTNTQVHLATHVISLSLTHETRALCQFFNL